MGRGAYLAVRYGGGKKETVTKGMTSQEKKILRRRSTR